MASGTSDFDGISTSTLTMSGAGWSSNQFTDMILIPDLSEDGYNYKISGNTSDTITVQGPIDLDEVGNGNTNFAVVYGKLIRSVINTPNSGERDVRLFNASGINSLADGDETYDGICQVCHTQVSHHRNDGSGPQQSHNDGQQCTSCHSHSSGFGGHSGGAGTGCDSCHGHDPGYEYSPGQFSQGTGTSHSHSTHTENDADDLRGPNVDCDTCHDTNNFPNFIYSASLDSNSDGSVDLSETDVCDSCHSPAGSYDGVNAPTLGSKFGNNGNLAYNWRNGVYYTDGNLKTGFEKWCASCHDETPSTIQGVTAPMVVGDEGASTNFGTGFGYYKTGHGLSPTETYPASGGTTPGAGLSCRYCHDGSMKHIDGVPRTYSYDATIGADNDYQHGYRLVSVDGQLPLSVPRIGDCTDTGVNATEFRLCLSCHDMEPYSDPTNTNTNFRNDSTGVNAHNYHLSIMFACGYGPTFQSDWDSSHGVDSRATCITCHNVHGSSQMNMVRDGRLVDRAPGLEVLYNKPGVTFDCFNYPTPGDVSLPNSTGTIWRQNISLCNNCHGSCGFDSSYDRVPYDNSPPWITRVQGDVGSDTLTVNFSEGVYSNLGAVDDLTNPDFSFTDLDDSRGITGVNHLAGANSATITLDLPLDSVDDIGTDTLAAATASSIYDKNDMAMDTTPVVITQAIASQMIIHPSGLDTANTCTPVGGDWADIMDSDDGATTYAECVSVYDASGGHILYPADFAVTMDDPAGLSGYIIEQLTVRAVVDVDVVTLGGPMSYAQVCYDTGGTNQECSVIYDLTGAEGFVALQVGGTRDPDGGDLDLMDLDNLRVTVLLNADDCCENSTVTAQVTEIFAEIEYGNPAADTTAPIIYNQSPANGALGVDTFSNLSFTLTDAGSGVNWNTLEVDITGDFGYEQLFTDEDFTMVSKTGSPSGYSVTVNPDIDFSGEETITVTVRASDISGNPMAPASWSFTTAAAAVAQTMILHPSGVASDGTFVAQIGIEGQYNFSVAAGD